MESRSLGTFSYTGNLDFGRKRDGFFEKTPIAQVGEGTGLVPPTQYQLDRVTVIIIWIYKGFRSFSFFLSKKDYCGRNIEAAVKAQATR